MYRPMPMTGSEIARKRELLKKQALSPDKAAKIKAELDALGKHLGALHAIGKEIRSPYVISSVNEMGKDLGELSYWFWSRSEEGIKCWDEPDDRGSA